MKRFLTLAAFAAGIALLWFLWPRHGSPSANSSAKARATASANATSTPRTPAALRLPPLEVSHAADALNSPSADIRADLRLVSGLLDTFRTNFPHDGNPVGDNAEITATLTGQNKLRFAFIPPDHSAINAAGELCDRWGTPFFFHAESGTHMVVRSAGPDKKMWTADDVSSQ